MKILCKQSSNPGNSQEAALFSLGIRQLYLKELSLAQDSGHITKKRHHHHNFEIHILSEGTQTYTVGNEEYVLQPGQFFLIPPLVPHQVLSYGPQARKYSLCFHLEPTSSLYLALPPETDCLQDIFPLEAARYLSAITGALEEKPPFFQWTVWSHLTALVLCLLRALGLKPQIPLPEKPDEEPRLTLAKQFIHDNIESAPSVSETAAYCHLSTRQLTRLFLQEAQCTPAAYIRGLRFRKIEMLLLHTELPLQQLSERMHFSTEYYFNTFFKQHAGMTPWEYRKMHRHSG